MKKVRNHGALWLVAFLCGAALVALGFFLHASYEHSRGYPRWLRDLLRTDEAPILLGTALLLTGMFAALFYWRGWFSKLPLQARLDLAAINARLDSGGVTTFPVELAHDRRGCHGLMMLTPGEVIFRCLRDEGITAGAVGKAAAGQFGLIGGLISGAASGARSHARDKDIAAARVATDPLPLDQQLAFNPHSFRLGALEIVELTTRMGARVLVTPTGPYAFQAIAEEDFAAVVAWLTRRNARIGELR